MITIEFNDLKELRGGLQRAQKKIRFALSYGINKSANTAKIYEQSEMYRVFDTPKPYTINSVFVRPSNYKRKSIEAKVGLKEHTSGYGGAGQYLEAQIEGGVRKHKRFETIMSVNGQKRKFRPSRNERLNRYGNMTKARIKKISQGVKSKTGKGGTWKFFAVSRNRRSFIFEKYGRGMRKVKPVLIETTGSYNKLFDFYTVGRRALEENYDRHMTAAMHFAFNG